jgi:hypothetical protein
MYPSDAYFSILIFNVWAIYIQSQDMVCVHPVGRDTFLLLIYMQTNENTFSSRHITNIQPDRKNTPQT